MCSFVALLVGGKSSKHGRFACWSYLHVLNYNRYFSGLAFWAACFVHNVIMSAATVEKPPALHLILHCRSEMSTNGPNCKNPTWKNTFPTPRFFDHTRVKRTYFNVALVLHISATSRQTNWLVRCQASLNRPYYPFLQFP